MFINKLAQNAKRQSATSTLFETNQSQRSFTPSRISISQTNVTPSKFNTVNSERQKSFVTNALQEISKEAKLKEERKTKTPQPKKKYRVDPFDLYSYNIARLNEVVEDQNLGDYVCDIEQELNFERRKERENQDKIKKANLKQRQWTNSKDIRSQFPPLITNSWSKRKQGRVFKEKSKSESRSQTTVSPIRATTARDPIFDVTHEINSPFFIDIVKDIDTTKDADQRISKRLASRRSYISQDGIMTARVETNPTVHYPSNFSAHDFTKSEGCFPPNYLQSLVEGKAREQQENFSYFTASLNEDVGRPYPLHFMSHREKQLADEQKVTNSIHKNLYLEQIDEYNRDAAKYKSPFIFLEEILACAQTKSGEFKKPSSFLTLIVTEVFDKFIEMQPKFSSILRQIQKYLIEAIFVNPEAAFSDYPSYKLKTDHYENGSQNIENYRFIVPKFQDCLPFHEAYKALISEILTLKEENHKYRERYWNEYRYSKIIDKWVTRIANQKRKSFLRTVFNEWVMVERGNADIWQTLMEAQSKAQKIPLRKAFYALKNNFQNNKERRYKEELNDLRFRVKENDQRITFLQSKINKLEYDKEIVGKVMKDREEELGRLQNELRMRSVSINDPELIRISLMSYFDQLFHKVGWKQWQNKGLKLIIENQAILSNHKHQRINKLVHIEQAKRVSFNRLIALWVNYMLGLTRNQIITRTRCISNVEDLSLKREGSSRRKQRKKTKEEIDEEKELDTSLDTPLRSESRQRLKNTPLKVGDVEQLFQPDYRALQTFLNLLPTKVTLRDTEELTSPAVLISVIKSAFSDFTFVRLLRVWRKKPEDRHRKIVSLLQELLGLDISAFFIPSDLNEGSIERSQEAFLKVYSLLFYKNAMLQKQGTGSPKKQIFKENEQYLFSLKPFHYISEIYGPFLQNWSFQDILPLLDRLELSKKMLSMKGIPKILIRWVNLMISNFKRKQKSQFFIDLNFTNATQQNQQRGFSRSSKNLLDLSAALRGSSSSSSIPITPEPMTPLSQSERDSTTGDVLYGLTQGPTRPRWNTVSKFGGDQLSSSTGYKSQSPVGKKAKSGFHKTNTQVIDSERAEKLTRQTSLVMSKRNSQNHSPSAAARLRKQVKNLMLMKQQSHKEKTKDTTHNLQIQGFPINNLNMLCENHYLGLFILVIVLETPRSVLKKLSQDMLSDIEIHHILMEYQEVLRVSVCQRLLIIVNGVYAITHKKHLVNLDQLQNNTVNNIEEIVAQLFISRSNLPVHQNTELAGQLQLVTQFYHIYKRALEESDTQNIVVDGSNKDIKSEEERELEKKHQKSLALDKVLKYAEEHHPQLDTALHNISAHYQAYQQVLRGVKKWIASQVLPRKVAQRYEIYNQPFIREALNFQNIFPGRFVISQILHSHHRTYSTELVDQIEDLFCEFEWPLKKMVYFFSSYEGSKMSYFDIWAFIKSFKLKTFEISPDDIEPNLLREMKGMDRDVIFENEDDNLKSSTVEEELYARSLSGITENSQERRKEFNANEPLVFYKLKIEPQIFFRVLLCTLIKNFSSKICDQLYYLYIQKENCCKIGYASNRVPSEPNYTVNPKDLPTVQKYKMKQGGFELNILHSLENIQPETLISSPQSSQSDEDESTTQIYTQQRAKSGTLSPVRDQRALNEWKDMGRVLKAFFKHCVLSRSQHFKKNIFRIEMRDPAFRKYLHRIINPLILIFEHYRCGTVVYSRRDSLFGSPLRDGHRNSSFSGLSRIEERVVPFDSKYARLLSQEVQDLMKLFIDISAFVGDGSLKSSQVKKIMEQVQNLDQLDRAVASLNARSESSQSRFKRQGIGSGSASPISSLLSVPQSPKPMELLHSPIPGQRGLSFSDFLEVLYLSAQYYYTDPYTEKLTKFGHFVENVLFKNLRQSIHFKKNFHSPYMQRLGKQIPSKRNCPKMEGSQLHADLYLSSKF